MKKLIYSDEWGEVRETIRYRGKKGRFISDKYGRRAKKQGKPYIKEIVEQWRIANGKRIARIMYASPDLIEKTTHPGAVADADGHIYDAIRTTNIFTEIHKANSAQFWIRGYNRQGEYIQLHGQVERFGKHNQTLQLVMAIESVLEEEGYGEKKKDKYYERLIKHVRGRERTDNPKIGLTQTSITVMLQ